MRPLGAPLALLLCQVLGSWAACALLPATGSGLQENPPRPSSPPATAPPGPGSRAAAALRGRGAPPAGPGGTCGAAGPGRRRARSSGAGLGAAGGPRWLPLNGSGRGGEGGAGGRGNGTGRRARLRNPFYPLTEESYGAYAVMCLSVVIFGIGIMGNMAVMCIVCHNYYMRSISNSLLANLAFWDFLIVFFCLPLVIFQELTKKWLLEDFSCKIVPYIEVMAVGGCAWGLPASAKPPGYPFLCLPHCSLPGLGFPGTADGEPHRDSASFRPTRVQQHRASHSIKPRTPSSSTHESSAEVSLLPVIPKGKESSQNLILSVLFFSFFPFL